MKPATVGIVGFGTVGSGVARLLLERGDSIRRKTGLDIRLKTICDLDITAPRGLNIPPDLLTTDLNRILDDDEISVAVELIGGTVAAKDVMLKLLAAGKDVVTANKALLAECGPELFASAHERGRILAFEASVGGGIPVLASLANGYLANDIRSIVGIINGTCNYILTKMTTERRDYGSCLREAQEKGFAEADPALDVGGGDSAHKLAILGWLGFAADFAFHDIYVEGITDLDVDDFRHASELGYVIKMLAIAKQRSGELELRVHPALLPNEHQLAKVSGAYNAIWIDGDAVGDTMLYGQGAGQMPTASAVVADVIDVLMGRAAATFGRLKLYPGTTQRRSLKPIEDIETEFYVRFRAKDSPGVLAEVSRILADNDISIASVRQTGTGQQTVPIVMLTHRAREGNLRDALERINRLDCINGPSRFIRVES